MPDIFVGGCKVRFLLKSTVPFALQRGQLTLCKERLLLDVNKLIVAIAACNACPKRTHPPHVEPTEINEFDIQVPPIVDNLGLDTDAQFMAQALEESASEVPDAYKEVPEGSQDLTAETAAVYLPVPPIEQRRKMQDIVQGAHAVSSILAPLPDYADRQHGGAELLNKVLEDYGSGATVMGSSKFKAGNHCLRRFFYRYIRGIFPKREENEKFSAVDIGSLFHAVMYNHVLTGGKETWEPLYRIVKRQPTGALDVKSVVDNYFRAHYKHDSLHYDFRGVEVPTIYICKPRLLRGKKRSLVISTRHDALIHQLRRSEARAAPGEPASSIYLRNYKTCTNIPQVNMAGLRTDKQTTIELFLARFGHVIFPDIGPVQESLNEIYGNVLGLEYDFIVKRKKFKPSTGTKRFKFNVSDEQLARQMVILEDFLYNEIGDRLYSDHWEDPYTWTQSFWCHDVYFNGWLCPYHRLCDSCGSQEIAERGFDQSDEYIVTPDNLQFSGKLKSIRQHRKRGKLFKPARGATQEKLE